MTLRRIDHSLPAIRQHEDDKAEPLSQQDYVALKEACKNRRDLLVVKGLRATGLRIAEFLRVEAVDVAQDGQFVGLHIRRGKQALDANGQRSHKWEWVYLPPEYGLEYREWMAGMGRRGNNLVFDVTPRTIERNVKAAAEQALGRPAHPHQLRGLYTMTVASIARELDLGLNLEVAGIMVGHTTIKTTRAYYTALTREVKQEIQRRVGAFV